MTSSRDCITIGDRPEGNSVLVPPVRYVIEACLTTRSPLAIHNGTSTHDLKAMGLMPSDQWFRAKVSNLHDGVEDCDALVARDWQGLPYIPGSSLKGVLREWLTRPAVYKEHRSVIDWMLGRESRGGDEASRDEGAGGAVIFEDAFLTPEEVASDKSPTDGLHVDKITVRENDSDESRNGPTSDVSCDSVTAPSQCPPQFQHLPFYDHEQRTYVEQHTSVNRRTEAVHHTGLFNVEVVPAGLAFRVRLVLDSATFPDDIDGPDQAVELARELLVRALRAFSLNPEHCPPQLGSDTQNGWGLMNCDDVRVTAWCPEEFRKADCPDSPAIAAGSDVPVRHRRVTLALKLQFHSPFLTCDPSRAVLRQGADRLFDLNAKEYVVGKKQPIPDQTPRVTGCSVDSATGTINGIALLTASAFKGSFRSRLEKILRTIHPSIGVSPHGQAEPLTDKSPEFVVRLLGVESQQSALWCSDFAGTDSMPLEWREMLAVDRFTGGAADGAKFNVLAFEHPTLAGTLAIDLPNDDNLVLAMLGAIALGVRDLIEGHISFGYGDMKAFGQCRGHVTSLKLSGFPVKLGHIQLPTQDEIDRLVSSFLPHDGNTAQQLSTEPTDSDQISKGNWVLNELLAAVRNASRQASDGRDSASDTLEPPDA